MKAFKYIFFLLLIAIIALSIYIAVQPNSYNVSRTRTINAPAAVIYDNVIDFKNWESWSSWAEKEESLKIMLPENTNGVGGSYSWEGDDGIGTMRTIAASPYTSITQEMELDEDYPKSNVSWTFAPNAEGTTDVTWAISGDNLPFMFKAYTAFSGSMDEQIGSDYERSLEKLDSIVVTAMKKYSVTTDSETTSHSGGYYLYNTTSTKLSDYVSKMQEMLPTVMAYAKTNNITMAGAPFILYHKRDVENNAVMFSSAVPTTAKVITTETDILTGQLIPFTAVKTTLKGDYSNLKAAWDSTFKFIEANGLKPDENGPMLESYLNNPLNTPNPANLVTEIYIAVKEQEQEIE
ncbi:transcription activator effector-binding protein [Bizionia saleffrena]|uniref:Transcription activator effector-binding protein n=1 Tax=Bizionia saleffrena TaxID=291189 RepID=A0A8H2LJB1_9FLAO|nr:SRPBCC family protein [Bizionia saleffrena]TYB80292.1 transcription activator effector-binding protein [Bizionia saleffrena]